MEPEVGDYVYYLPHLYEVKAVVWRGVYGIGGVKTRYRTVVALNELYTDQRPPITTQECNRMKVRLENSEKLGVASLQLQKQHKSVQQENGMKQRQVVELKQQLIVAEQRRENFRARIEANNSLVELECLRRQIWLDCESARTESDALSAKTASRVRKLVLKLEPEINAKELTTRRLQKIEKKLPGTEHCQYTIYFEFRPLQRLRKSNGDSDICLYWYTLIKEAKQKDSSFKSNKIRAYEWRCK